jgi:hypothetical protein
MEVAAEGHGQRVVSVQPVAAVDLREGLAKGVLEEQREVAGPFQGLEGQLHGAREVGGSQALVADAEPEQCGVLRLGQHPGGGAGFPEQPGVRRGGRNGACGARTSGAVP